MLELAQVDPSGIAMYLVLFLSGLIAGTLNIIAGGGSFLTLPVLIFLGLPSIAANGTNRVGIFFQNIAAVWTFHSYKKLDWSFLPKAAIPAALGAVAGVWLAFSVEDHTFRRVLALLMILFTFWTLLDPLKWIQRNANSSYRRYSILWTLAFGVAGAYAGFVQAGVGFLVLAIITTAGLDLVRGNAVKVLVVLATTVISLSLFTWQGQVMWLPGLVLAAGTTLGGQVGVHLTVLKGQRWVRMVVLAAVLLFAVKLWFSG